MGDKELLQGPQTSPKRKRTSDASEKNEHTSGDVGAYTRRLVFYPNQTSAMRSTIGKSNDTGEHPLIESESEGENAILQGRLPQVKVEEDIKIREYLLKAMVAAQKSQARACGNLLVLTNKLHDWARHLDEQERWLHKERCQLIEQQQALTEKHLDVATGRVKHSINDPGPSKTPDEMFTLSNSEQVQQFKTVIEVLEGNIEVLISELQIEKEARKAAEDELREKEGTADRAPVQVAAPSLSL